jgi:DNA polymerase-1
MINNFKRPILVIDGMNLFIRYFVANQATNADGELYGGTVGFVNSIKDLVKQFKPSKVFVVWEKGGGSPRRKQIYSEYKANRAKTKNFDGLYKNQTDALLEDKELKAKQLLVLTKALSFLPVCQLYISECEGDDIVAYLVKTKFRSDPSTKIIVSSDHDFYQLLEDDTIAIYNPTTKLKVVGKDVIEKFSISPRNFCLARAIVGDVSDNIKGIEGVGLKTVSKRFPMLLETDKDYLVNDIASHSKLQIEQSKKPAKCYQDVLNNLQIVLRNWKLMFLDTHVFSDTQVQTLNNKIDNFTPKINHLEFLRVFIKSKIPVSEELNAMTQELRYLTIIS